MAHRARQCAHRVTSVTVEAGEIPVLPFWTGAGTGRSSVLRHKEPRPLQTPLLRTLRSGPQPAPPQLTLARLLDAFDSQPVNRVRFGFCFLNIKAESSSLSHSQRRR